MCGRFHFMYTPAMEALFAALGVNAGNPGKLPNLAPTDDIPIIFEQQGRRECHLARWWLTPNWSKGPDTRFSMFNARAENLESSRAFKGPFHHKRCLVPATAFIEWQAGEHGKQPMEIQREDGEPLLLAGLWDSWNEELLSCAIITTAATPSMARIHKRMPVMLAAGDADRWLAPDTPIDQLLPLFTPHLPATLRATPIDKAINNARLKTIAEPTGKPPLSLGPNDSAEDKSDSG